jgi:hypothetical protein
MAPRTHAQREEHLLAVEQGLIQGVSPYKLLPALQARFGLSIEQAQSDLRLVQKRLAQEGERIARGQIDPQQLSLAARRRERIYRDALKAKDPKLALEAEKDRCRLLGFYPAERPEQPGESESYNVDQAIEFELARLAQRGQAGVAATAAEAERPDTSPAPAD